MPRGLRGLATTSAADRPDGAEPRPRGGAPSPRPPTRRRRAPPYSGSPTPGPRSRKAFEPACRRSCPPGRSGSSRSVRKGFGTVQARTEPRVDGVRKLTPVSATRVSFRRARTLFYRPRTVIRFGGRADCRRTRSSSIADAGGAM